MKIIDTLRAVNIRESKAWKAIDWALSDANKDARVKVSAAEFILKRIYPERMIHGGTGEGGEIKVTVEIGSLNENQITSEPGNRISQYLEV